MVREWYPYGPWQKRGSPPVIYIHSIVVFFRHFAHTRFYLLKEIHVRSKADLVLIPPETNSLCMTETTSSKLDTCLKKSVFLLVFFFF